MQRLVLSVFVFLFPAIAFPQYYTLTGDFQSPDKQFVIPAVFSGNTPFLRYEQYERNVEWSFENTTNGGPWTMYFRYGYGQYDTNGMVTINGTISSNVALFSGSNVFFESRSYYFSILGINLSGQQKTFARGTMEEHYDPASGTNITALIGQMNLSWWTQNMGAVVSALQTGKLDKTEFNAVIATNNTFTNGIANTISTNDIATWNAVGSGYTNAVQRTGDTMTGTLTVNTNLSVNAGGSQWYIGSMPDQFWIGNGLWDVDAGNELIYDATNYDLHIGGAFIGSAAKLTSFPDTLATTSWVGTTYAPLASLAAATNYLNGAITSNATQDAATSNTLYALHAAETNARIAADALNVKTSDWASADSTTNYVRRTGDRMLGNLDVSVYTGYFRTAVIGVGGMVMKVNGSSSSTGIVFQTGNSAQTRSLWNYAGSLYKDTYRIFDESNLSTGDLWGAISTNAAQILANSNSQAAAIAANTALDAATSNSLRTAIDGKVSSVALLPTLTVGDLASVGTNLCTGFVTQTGTLGGVKITNIYANIAAGKTYAWGLGLESTYIGTSWLSCASFTLTNVTPGSRASNYFSLASSTDRVVLTISSVAGMAQIVTNVFVCEVRTGTVWIAGDARVGGDIIAANYGHNIPLMTNVEDVAIGKSAAASGLGVAVGGYANGQADGTAVGKSSEGYNYGSSVGYMANGINYGAALGFFANAESCGVALGRFANGTKSNIAIGASAKSVGSLSISIGHEVTNSTDNSAALRGSLYLDGGTGIYYRSTFGSGEWSAFSASGADMTQAVHDASAHATNYVPRTGGTMSGGISNDVGFFVDLDSWQTGIINFGNDGYIKLNGSTKISIASVGNLVGPWMANGDFFINGTGRVDHTLSVSGAVTAASYDDGTNSLDVGLGTWNGQAIIDSGASPDLTYLSNGVNSWIASSNDLAVVTNDYPAGTLGIVASSDGGTTLYLKAEATAGAELDPIAGALGTNNALSIQAVGVVATNAQTWAIAASNLAAGAVTKTNRWTPATAVCSTGTVQFAPGANNLYTYLPTNPFTVQMAYGVTDVGTVRFEVQASTCTITWGASVKNSGRDSSTNLTMSTTTNMSFILDKRYGESKASIYQIGL